MSKYKIINLFDKIFITSAVFLLIFAWINFFTRDLVSTFFLSLIFSAAVVFLIFYTFNKKQTKKTSLKKYLKDIDDNFLAFRLMSKTDQLTLINRILKLNHTTRIFNEMIAYKKDGKTHAIIIATNIEKIGEFEFVNLVQGKLNFDVIEIICNDYSTNINANLLNNTTITFIPKKKLYDELFSKNSIYPNLSVLNLKNPKPKMKEILKHFFVPNKAKSYFFCGLILIFSSIILPYHYYYLIFGSILLIFSLVCKLQPIFKH